MPTVLKLWGDGWRWRANSFGDALRFVVALYLALILTLVYPSASFRSLSSSMAVAKLSLPKKYLIDPNYAMLTI